MVFGGGGGGGYRCVGSGGSWLVGWGWVRYLTGLVVFHDLGLGRLADGVRGAV